MAKSSRATARYLQTPARWYQDFTRARRAAESVDDWIAAGLAEKKRISEESYLKDSIKLLRRFAKGFEASDGFALDKLALIPQRQIDRVKKYAPILRQETARILSKASGEPVEYYKIVRPRSARGRAALERFTGQIDVPKRKGYVVPVERPIEKVRLVSRRAVKLDKRGRRYHTKSTEVEVTHKVGRRIFYNRYFRFSQAPMTFDDIIRMTRELLPTMPQGYYVMETSNHGAIHVPTPKNLIVRELQDYFLGYDSSAFIGKDNRGLAETVIGYRLIGDYDEDAARFVREKETKRMAFANFRARRRSQQARKAQSKLKGKY